MHQDEAGRWVSDDGRYLWSGTEWLDLDDDLLGPAQPDEDPTSQPTHADPGSAPFADADADISADPAASRADPAADPADSRAGPEPDAAPASAGAPPAEGAPTRAGAPAGAGAPARAGAPAGARSHGTLHGSGAPASRSHRPLLLIGLVVLVALAGGVVLLAGRSDDPKTQAAAPSPSSPGQPPAPSASAPASSQVLDESQRRDLAEVALLTRADLPGTTEERRSNPTDVFLPCRAPALTPPPGTVLTGQRVSNSDFSTYAGQTVAGFPSAREAGEALDTIRRAVEKCAPYDYAYVNSSRVDHITFSWVDSHFAVGDAGLYLEEHDTPANYAGSPTGYGYGYVQRGQFLVRLTVTVASKAQREQTERLMRLAVGRLG